MPDQLTDLQNLFDLAAAWARRHFGIHQRPLAVIIDYGFGPGRELRIPALLATAPADDTPAEPQPFIPPAPVGPGRRPPIGCPGDILRVLRETGRRLTTTEILRELAGRGCSYADSTVKHTLSVLVEMGYLFPAGDGHRGYGLAENPTN